MTPISKIVAYLFLCPLLAACSRESTSSNTVGPAAGAETRAPTPAPTAQTLRPSELSLGDLLPAPDVPMLGVDGRTTTIGAVGAQHGTLVLFTTNHCPWAQAWEGRMTALGNEFLARGVGVIAINPNDPTAYSKATFAKMKPAIDKAGVDVTYSPDTYEEMQRRADAAGMQFPYVVDATSDVARSFGATKTPQAYLFDGEGSLVYQGAIDDNAFAPDKVEHKFLRDALEALTSARQLPRSESRAIGCSISFRAPS